MTGSKGVHRSLVRLAHSEAEVGTVDVFNLRRLVGLDETMQYAAVLLSDGLLLLPCWARVHPNPLVLGYWKACHRGRLEAFVGDS